MVPMYLIDVMIKQSICQASQISFERSINREKGTEYIIRTYKILQNKEENKEEKMIETISAY